MTGKHHAKNSLDMGPAPYSAEADLVSGTGLALRNALEMVNREVRRRVGEVLGSVMAVTRTEYEWNLCMDQCGGRLGDRDMLQAAENHPSHDLPRLTYVRRLWTD